MLMSRSGLGSESDPESGSESEVGSMASPRVPGLRCDRQYNCDPCLPNFTGWESWKTWYTHFYDVASRRGWDHEKYLDMMLPMLEGLTGDYVFDELSSGKHSNYKVFIKHLKHQLHKVQSAKTYATMFWREDQKVSKTEEVCAAELKCIYGKVYLKHDCSAQDKDLLHRFLNVIMNQRTQQQIKFVKGHR